MTQSIKKKRVSKKNKISWRKNIDIQDVENFLEDQRLEERIGKVKDKPDEELFIVDKVKEAKPKSNKLISITERRLQKANRIPKCHAALVNTSKVDDPIVKRNHVIPKDERKHPIKKIIEAKKREQGIIPHRELQSIHDRLSAHKIKSSKNRKITKAFEKDIWEIENVKERKLEFNNNQWIDRNVVEHNLKDTGTPITKIPASAYHKRSKLNPISIPHPGISYNPKLKDHTDLMKKVVDKECNIIKNEEHLNRVTTSMFSKVTADERDLARLTELENAIDENEIKPETDNGDDTVYRAVNPPVRVKPKDKKTRRKQREQKEIKERLKVVKLERRKITDIHRLRHLNKDVLTMELKLKKLRKRKLLREEQKKLEPRRLGRSKFQDEEIDMNTLDELPGNLRNVKQEGSILTDRFVSMQKRNILVPVSDRGLRRRREIKRFVRNTHKEIDENQPVIKKANKKKAEINKLILKQ